MMATGDIVLAKSKKALHALVEWLAALAVVWELKAKDTLRWNLIEQTAIDLTDGDPTLQNFGDRLFKPFAVLLTRLGVRAAHLSLAGVLFALMASLNVEVTSIFVACLFANMLCDGLDGVIARYQDLDSDAGAVLDVGCDTLSILLVIAGLYVNKEISIWMFIIFGVVIMYYTLISMVKSKLLCDIYRSVGSRVFTFLGLAVISAATSFGGGVLSFGSFLFIIVIVLLASLAIEKVRSFSLGFK